MAGRAIETGAQSYPAKHTITATKATATLMVTATKATATLTVTTGITDPLACGTRAAAMEAGLDRQFPLAPTIGV